MIDLGAWATESYRVAGEEDPNEPEGEDPKKDEGEGE